MNFEASKNQMSTFYELTIAEINPLTDMASSIAFDVPPELYETFNYKPGQYLTLKFIIGGEEVRRSYSLCSSPSKEEYLRVGVKRVEGGLVSNYINDHLKVGDAVEVMPPEGRFFVNIKKGNYKTYYLFAAGSGITPILSILRTVLYSEPNSYVHMIYGNKNQDSIMFFDLLQKLEEQFQERLILVHALSSPKSKWSDLWTSKNEQQFRKGRVDDETIRWFITEYPPYAQNAEYYLCGPGTMIQNTKKTLMSLDVPESRIFFESFGGNTNISEIEGYENAELDAQLNGEKIEITIPKGKTILRALIDAGKEPPYSCEGGVCATCVAKITNGKAEMKTSMALDNKEIKNGLILTCQAIPTSEKLAVVYK